MKRETIARIFCDQPTIETERLILRRIMPTDAEDMFEYANDKQVPRYLLWNPHPSLAYTKEYLAYLESRYAVGDFFDWAVVVKSSGKMIGTCGFTRFRYEDDCGEIGYVLSPDFHGSGLGTEAAKRDLRFGFEVLGLHRIEVKFMQGNAASLRVSEKLGMQFEGYHRDAMFVKGQYRTIGMSAILAEEFFQNEKK